jgi:hypothetical protein
MDAAHLLFVVAEVGARWPAWLSRRQKAMPDVVMVAGTQGETPAELALRVQRRVEQVETRGAQIAMAVVLASGDAPNDEQFQARCLMSRSVLTHLTRHGKGSLVFGSSAPVGSSAGLELMSLVGTLTSQLASSQLTIGIRFESGADVHSSARGHEANAVA